MKTNSILTGLLSMMIMMSCGNDYDIDEYFDLVILPGYVAFTSSDATILADIETSEGDGIVTINIENPTGTESDISVNYEFGGSAVFGVDFDVAGASASGGTLLIPHKTEGPAQFDDNADLEIDILTDGVVDGNKTLTITLISASNAEGDVAVGRGGTDYLKEAKINIADID